MTGTASHAAGAGMLWPWVSSHQGSQAPPSPGTTTVNTTLRTTRPSDRVIVAPYLIYVALLLIRITVAG